MSLKITSTIQTPQGEELNGLYGRVAVVNSIYGNRIEAIVELFKDQAAFEAGKDSYQFREINTGFAIDYDYATGEKDILDLAHDVLVVELAKQGITAVKELS